MHYIAFHNNYNWGSARVSSIRLFYKLKYSEGIKSQNTTNSFFRKKPLYTRIQNKKCTDTSPGRLRYETKFKPNRRTAGIKPYEN